MKLINKITSLLESTSIIEADAILCRIMADIDCGKFSYNHYPLDYKQTGEIRHVLCTQPAQEWQKHYSQHHYHQIDPILQRMRKSHLPLGWKLEEEFERYNKNQKKLFSDALEFGLRGGFAVPIHAPSGEFANLVVQDVSVLNLIDRYPEIKHTLLLAAYHYNARVSQFLEKENSCKLTNQLTPRELECIRLTSQHKTAKEIAKILKITPRTVGFHIENAISKLEVKNKYQAVSKANLYGILDL